MTTQTAPHQPRASEWGSVALVTYVPEPLGSFLTELRQYVTRDHNPKAHITFLPPRSLSTPVQVASAEIEETLRSVPSFEVELGDVQVFPRTNMLYLSVETGHAVLMNLHAGLNKGGLFAQESFDFTPHLTLSDPLPPGEIPASLKKAELAWNASGLSRRFVVDKVTLLWRSGDYSENDWVRLSAFPLDLP